MLRERGIYILPDGNRYWASWQQTGWILELCDADNPTSCLSDNPVAIVKQKVGVLFSVSETGNLHRLSFPPGEGGPSPKFVPKLASWLREERLRVVPFRKPTLLNTGWSVDDLRDTGENNTH
jgi:hypothetical protein